MVAGVEITQSDPGGPGRESAGRLAPRRQQVGDGPLYTLVTALRQALLKRRDTLGVVSDESPLICQARR